MNAKILDFIPISGKYSEVLFGSGNKLLWVLFSSDTEEWIGKFELGFKSKSKLEILPNSICAILADGNVFFIQLEQKKLIYCHPDNNIEDLIYIPELDSLLITDGLRLGYLNISDKQFDWKTNRISWDGVVFDSYSDGIVKGKLNDLSDQMTGCPFEFNIYENRLQANYNAPPPSSFS